MERRKSGCRSERIIRLAAGQRLHKKVSFSSQCQWFKTGPKALRLYFSPFGFQVDSFILFDYLLFNRVSMV